MDHTLCGSLCVAYLELLRRACGHLVNGLARGSLADGRLSRAEHLRLKLLQLRQRRRDARGLRRARAAAEHACRCECIAGVDVVAEREERLHGRRHLPRVCDRAQALQVQAAVMAPQDAARAASGNCGGCGKLQQRGTLPQRLRQARTDAIYEQCLGGEDGCRTTETDCPRATNLVEGDHSAPPASEARDVSRLA